MLRSIDRIPLVSVVISLSSLGLASACASGGDVDDGGFGTFTTVAGDGDGNETTGDGDPSGDGDGDGDASGDGDGDASGDGDGDASGDGDGDASGDGDGEADLCGNAVIDPGEECDSANNGGETCISLGYDGGSLLCADDCTYDTSTCETIEEFCGDGIANLAEDCDGADLGGQDCASQGFLSGNIACSGSCTFDTSGCSSTTIIDLEGGVVPAGFSGGGNAQWLVTSNQKWEGTYGARSGVITDSQSTWAQVTVQFVSAGSVSFYHKISSESGWDYGRFTIDGGQQGEWSGSGSWVQQSYNVAAGQHTLRWTYSKDASLSSYDDAWYVDYIVLTNGYVP